MWKPISLWGVLAAYLTTVIQGNLWQDFLPGVRLRANQLARSQAHRAHPLGAKSPLQGTAGTWGPTSSGCVLLPQRRQWCCRGHRQRQEKGVDQSVPGAVAIQLRLDQDSSLRCWLKEGSGKLGYVTGVSGRAVQTLEKTAHKLFFVTVHEPEKCHLRACKWVGRHNSDFCCSFILTRELGVAGQGSWTLPSHQLCDKQSIQCLVTKVKTRGSEVPFLVELSDPDAKKGAEDGQGQQLLCRAPPQPIGQEPRRQRRLSDSVSRSEGQLRLSE